MPDTTPGLQVPQEPAQATPPAHVELSQVTPPATSAAAPAPSPAQPSPEIAALEHRLAVAEQRQKDTQAAYTRSQQALSALSGNPANQGPSNPLDPYIKDLTDQGYDAKDAAVMAGFVHKMVAPLQQQLLQTQAITQSSMQVDNTMQAAYAASPQAFANPAVYQQVHHQLQQDAARGMQIDPGYAAALAKQAWFDATYNAAPPVPGQQPAAAPQLPPMMRGMTGITGNYGGHQQVTQQPAVLRTAEQVQLGNILNQRIGK